MKYPNVDSLRAFLADCETELLDDKNKKSVIYPEDAITPWDAKAIREANEPLLSSASGVANVYAIFAKSPNSNGYILVYIGQTNSKGARTRLSNHLIKKNSGTGAKLEHVIEHVQGGGEIKITYIPVEPMSLRHYVEEELIDKHRDLLVWNKHGKKKT